MARGANTALTTPPRQQRDRTATLNVALFRGFLQAPVEPVHTTTRVNKFLLTGVERVALVAQFDPH
jgi:hypothetical protein